MNYSTPFEAPMLHFHARRTPRCPGIFRQAAFVALFLLSAGANALPEDASQQIDIDANSNQVDLDLGLVIYRGTPETPVRVSQGSMLITGTEVRIEMRDGALQRATAIGSPARFQQQPAADKAIVHVSGQTLTFDNAAQVLTADVAVELIQAGYTVNANHIDYDIKAGRANATGSPDGEQTRTTIPPQTPAN